jgi:GTP:adenosylcobinamide-phosphate guanylyltransferase
MKNNDVLSIFINGTTFFESNSSNLSINGNKLINYRTCIAEKIGGKIIVNVTKYSPTTSKIQNSLIKLLQNTNFNYATIDKIRMGSGGLV